MYPRVQVGTDPPDSLERRESEVHLDSRVCPVHLVFQDKLEPRDNLDLLDRR